MLSLSLSIKPVGATSPWHIGIHLIVIWQELSNEYQHDRVQGYCQIFLRYCALDECSLSIERLMHSV